MKTAGRENPNHGVTLPRNRAPGAVGQNKSRSIKWAEKQEKFRPKEMCFFLTSPFIDADHSTRTSSLRFAEPRLRRDRESIRASRKGQGVTPRPFCFLAGETTSSTSLL